MIWINFDALLTHCLPDQADMLEHPLAYGLEKRGSVSGGRTVVVTIRSDTS